MKKFIQAFTLFYQTSNLMNFKKKKRKILVSVFLSNFVVFFDILIILFFTNFLTGETFSQIEYLSLILNRKFLLPFIIALRFLAVYLDTMNIQYLRLGVEEQLRKDLVNDIFTSGNLSSSDSYFYLNVLAPNVGSFYQFFTTLISSFIQLFFFMLYLIISNQNQIIYIFIIALLLYPLVRGLVKLGRKSSHKAFLKNQEVSNEIEKIIENLFLIKILKKIDYEIEAFSSYLKQYYKEQILNQKFGTINSLFPVSLGTFIMAGSLLFLNLSFITLDFIGVIIRLSQSLGSFNKNLSWAATQFVYLERLQDMDQNRKVAYNNESNTNNVLEENKVLKFDKVNFKFRSSEKFLFKDLNLEIYKNKKYLLIGPNGSGKSTLIGLMAGVLHPTSGSIYLNRFRVGYVSAYPMILKDTIKNNLLYGNETIKISDEELVKYINDLATFEKFTFKDLDNQVSNKTLSSGQMQKIAFIRSFISNPEVLFLDESTSNLDIDSKKIIINFLSNKNLTIVNSTHNQEDFKNYDFLIEISNIYNNFSNVIQKKL